MPILMLETRIIYPVDITAIKKELYEIANKLQVSQAEAIRQAIRYYYEWVQNLKVVTPRVIPMKQAKKEIMEFLNKSETTEPIYTDEISDALNLDYDLTHKALMELWKDGEVVREEN